MRKLFSLLNGELRNGRESVLVTVIASSGSTPRRAGAHMLVTNNGRMYGTIGGGAVELHSEQIAQEVLESKNSRIEYYQVQDLGMICGGDIHIYFHYVPAYDASILALTKGIENMYQRAEQSWLIYKIALGQGGTMGIYGEKSGLFGIDAPSEAIKHMGSKPVQAEYGGHLFYCEKLVQAGKVYIFGGGHVAQALVPAMSAVDFRCIVLDDRDEFCHQELFVGVEAVQLINNDRIADYVTIGEDDYVVIMTRGHKDDQKVLAQILMTPARYIGVIGSRRKSEAVFFNLRELGFTESDLRRITTPIGLEIKAETPEEIAVSITAQMILERAECANSRCLQG